ncbi:MAG: UDP-N-acetylmuramate dehydrogenase [Chloroflexota bacterium]
MTTTLPLDALHAVFGERLQTDVPLAAYTSARIGGPAEALIAAHTSEELAKTVSRLWEMGVPFILLGGGSNVLVSDAGVRGVVVLNRAKAVTFFDKVPSVWAESGVTFSNLANRVAAKGYTGLEWAATVPGTVGGAVYGNAGAFGGDMAGSLRAAEVLTREGRKQFKVREMGYGYRTSVMKRGEVKGVILSAELRLDFGDKEAVLGRMREFTERRKSTQPPGASMGSMFKNPEGDFAGRLLEEAGLKGAHIGNAVVSPVHANFFVNNGETSAADVKSLIDLAQATVRERFGIQLELEIELVGEW